MGILDVGILTVPEMVNHARNIISAISMPLICDADNGYGNTINVIRAISEYEKVGIVGIHIEDQAAPKKCSHFVDKQLRFRIH
jgi:2-methylisocitrate lyase-like PEP mutase family enzyme